ncbi:alkaline phosphatase D family protein [Govanella unica]|uniref:Alkaline phosphatase D family protein n=1 Tax=Govanella unica TaxID=2975056 RepID=A0A9X3TVW9_9PROT|nr:alkaline phosphatase D family protein [Govania unica]MDA5192534.1 alkaline phosphatase D family protein [Govania unica]
MTITRRDALRIFAAASLATPALAVPLRDYKGSAAFLHGVASGDPGLHDVIIWTRITPEGETSGADLIVDLEIATTPDFKQILRRVPRLRAPAARDYTIKHLLDRLAPGTDYYYRFRHGERLSPTGRTKTLPEKSPKDVVFAVASCALWSGGYFNAYDAMARRTRLDAVIHLGDYIYEYGAAAKDYGMAIGKRIGRSPQPAHSIFTLADYRERHAQYKTDPHLQAAHARAPWITVWDDHEVANDSWHGGSSDDKSGDSADWIARKAAALQAYYEWMPIREPLTNAPREAACRTFRFGDLAEIMMVETRLTGRDDSLDYKTDLTWDGEQPQIEPFLDKLQDPDREMLGPWQEDWLRESLKQSVEDGIKWQVLGNQVVMARVAAPDVRAQMTPENWDKLIAPMSGSTRDRVLRNNILSRYDIPSNLDSWDGYPAARERVYDAIKAAKAHVVALAGDSHMFWANELWDAERRQLVAAEFATSSITSPSYGDAMPGAPIGDAFTARNREVIYNDPTGKGFLVVTLSKARAEVEFVTVSTILEETYTASVSKTFTVTRKPGGGVGQIREG